MSIDSKIAKLIGKNYPGESPKEQTFVYGLEGIHVQLIDGPGDSRETVAALMGAAPWTEHFTRDTHKLIKKAQATGKMMGNYEEAMKFTFYITGITRACTHQLVRTRVGACFSQESGRVCDWRHKPTRIPRTVSYRPRLEEKFKEVAASAKELYSCMVDAGVPLQDARRILPIGTTTYIYETINFRALRGLMANRLCPSQADWEINCVMWLIKDTMEKEYPELAKLLVPRCCLVGKCIHEGDLFPPCGLFERSYNIQDYRHRTFTDNGIYIEKCADVSRRLLKCKRDMEKMKNEQEEFENEL